MKKKAYPGAEMLEEPWYSWADWAEFFAQAITPEADREDFVQDCILELARMAEKYRRQGRTMNQGTYCLALRYYRMNFYGYRARRQFDSLDRLIRTGDEDAPPTRVVDTLADPKEQDWARWLDAAIHVNNASALEKQAIRNLLNGAVGRVNIHGHRHANTPREETALKRFRDRWKEGEATNERLCRRSTQRRHRPPASDER